jgi:hypothetical protein
VERRRQRQMCIRDRSRDKTFVGASGGLGVSF